MNNTKRREFDLRKKLMAAIAMLLVSSIMMVSTTYAWFTLSTAPEVQGITTTVGANGSLEIALSPLSGDYNEIDSNVGDSTKDWFEKNVTWGNLLDLSDSNYELSAISLTPAQLKLASGAVDTTSPLARPAYGADGRVSELKADTNFGGKTEVTDETTGDVTGLSAGFLSGEGGYGVRAIGTASGLSENERVFTSGKSALRTGTTQAASVASASLNANGNALANLMVAHAMADQTDTNDYAQYVPALNELVAALEDSVTQIDNAMKGALTAAAATVLTGDELTTAVSGIEGGDMGTFSLDGLGVADSVATSFATVQAARNSIKSDVDAAKSAADALPTDGTAVSWDAVYGVVKYLMNTSGVTINGQTVEYVSANYTDMISDLLSGIELKLGEGSGVYYKIHQIASKIAAGTTVSIDASGIVAGMGTVNVACTIETTYTGGSYLPAMTAVLSQMSAASESAGEDGTTSATKLDVYYGYALDFVFRTNAAGSYLQLQTEAANRVYSDDGSEITQGSGSTITFTIPDGVDSNIVKGLVEGIRVTFYDTASGELFGIAKVTSVVTEEVTDETAGTVTTNMVGTLELCSYEANENGLVTVGDVIEDTTAADGIDQTKALCSLDQNVAKRVTAMVSLDGSDITNADIMSEGNVTGVLNLQFSSSASLVPMENSELKDGGNS